MRFHMRLKRIKFVMITIAALLLTPVMAGPVSAGGMIPDIPQPPSGSGMGAGGQEWNWSEDRMWLDGMGFIPGDAQQMEVQIEQMMQEGMRYELFAPLCYSSGTVDGHFIDFLYDEVTGTVMNYTVQTGSGPVRIFDKIAIDGFDPDATFVRGAVLHADNGSVQVIIHDNPAGMYHVVSNDTPASISLRLAEGVEIAQIFDCLESANITGRKTVLISAGSVKGVFIIGNGTINIGMVEDGASANLTVTGNAIIFRVVGSICGRNQILEEALLHAITQNRVGGEVSLITRGVGAMYDIMEYHQRFRIEVMSAFRNSVTLQVSSEDHEGKIVLLNFDRETMNAEETSIEVIIDGEEVREASDICGAVLATGSSSSDAVYSVLSDGDLCHVIIYVPTFSTHVIQIQGISIFDKVLTPEGLSALFTGILVVFISAIVLFKKRK